MVNVMSSAAAWAGWRWVVDGAVAGTGDIGVSTAAIAGDGTGAGAEQTGGCNLERWF